MGTINLNELQRAINVVLDHLIKTRGIETVNLDKDFYWDIPSETLYDMNLDPPNLRIDVGSLYCDWEMFGKLLQTDWVPVCYQLTQVAPLLRYIGEATAAQTAGKGG
jgi:hypothetical protein